MNIIKETKNIELYDTLTLNSHIVEFYKNVRDKFSFIIFDENKNELYKSIDYISFDMALQDATDTAKIYF